MMRCEFCNKNANEEDTLCDDCRWEVELRMMEDDVPLAETGKYTQEDWYTRRAEMGWCE